MFVIAKIRLAKETRKIQTKTGARMEASFGFVDIDDDKGLPVGVVAFGSLADELAKYSKGSMIRVSGIFKSNSYVNKESATVDSFQLVADGIAGIKSARGKYSSPKPKADPETQQQRNQASADFYEDKLSF